MENESDIGNEARKQSEVQQIYQNDQIAVYWEPKLCIHSGHCFRGLPDVLIRASEAIICGQMNSRSRNAK